MQYVDEVTDGHLYSEGFGESGTEYWSSQGSNSHWDGEDVSYIGIASKMQEKALEGHINLLCFHNCH